MSVAPLILARAKRRWRQRWPGPVVCQGEPAGSRRIALTFDDGPSQWTPAILAHLGAHGARASFFILGASIVGREELLRRIAAEGHELGNHMQSHRDPSVLGDREIRAELRATARRFERLGLPAPTLVRPPYGGDPGRVARIAKRLGAGPVVLWSIDPHDWRFGTAHIVDAIMSQAHDGAIVCLHDGRPEVTASAPTREATVAAVERLLPELAGQGYRFVTVSELLRPGSRRLLRPT